MWGKRAEIIPYPPSLSRSKGFDKGLTYQGF